MDMTPWRRPEVPPRIGSSAKSKPTAQSWQAKTAQTLEAKNYTRAEREREREL